MGKSNILSETTNATDSVSLAREWLYNNRSELAAATIGMNQYGYEYDTIGNRLWSADNIITNSYSANSLNQYTTVGRAAPSAPQTSLLYDADGNMTHDGAYTYSYDAENRLRSVTSRSMTNGAIRVLNAYDHRNRRIRKTVQRLHSTSAPPPAPPSGTDEWLTLETHTFVWDGNNIVLEKVEFADGTTRTFEYFWGADKSGTEQGAGGVGGLLAVSLDGVFYIPCYDNNGNITRYLDANGNTVAQYTYDAFGNLIAKSGPLADFFRHRFSTKYYDAETGLYYYGYRFYHPALMRWLNHDPMEEKGSRNLTSFIDNKVLIGIDPLGDLLVIVLGGKESVRRGMQTAHTQVKNKVSSEKERCKRIVNMLKIYPESTYNCLRDKGRVYFDSKQFHGSLSDFRKKVERELSSVVCEESVFSQSLKSLAKESVRANQPYDFVVYAAHGEPAFSDVGISIFYQDGLQDQKEVAKQVEKNMKNSAGMRLFVSCYRTWRGKGKPPPNLRERLTIHSPTLKTKNELRFVPFKASRTIGR